MLHQIIIYLVQRLAYGIHLMVVVVLEIEVIHFFLYRKSRNSDHVYMFKIYFSLSP